MAQGSRHGDGAGRGQGHGTDAAAARAVAPVRMALAPGAVVMARLGVGALAGMDVEDAIAVVMGWAMGMRLGRMGMARRRLAVHEAGAVGMEAGHRRAVQHQRRHRGEHDARNDAT